MNKIINKNRIINCLLVIFTSIFLLSIFIGNKVNAEDVVFSINSATIKDKSNDVTGIINNSGGIINSDITFNKIGDYVIYEIEFKNNKDNKVTINSINDTNTNDYITYEYDKHENYEVDSNATFILSIKALYKTAVNNIDNRNQDNEVSFSINYDENQEEDVVVINPEVNPKTFDNIPTYIIVAIISIIGIIVCLILKDKRAHVLLLTLLMIPAIVKANSSVLSFTIKNKIVLNDQIKVTYKINGQENEAIVKYGDTLNINYEGILLLEDGTIFDSNTPITGDLYLTEVKYNITYELNGGVLPDGYPTQYTDVDSITLTNPTKDGYRFTGWTGSNGNAPQTTVKIFQGTTGDKEYTANWELENYDITYNLDGGTLPDIHPTSYTIESSAITLVNPTKEGYTFTGWTGANGTTPETTVTIPQGSVGSRIYEAHWTIDTYNITYTLAGGVLPDIYPTSYTIETETFNLKNPTRDGYTFAGWTGSNGNTPQTTVTITQGTTGDKAYTANWEAKTYNITYTLDGGTLPDIHPTNYTIESSAITLVNPTKDGLVFAGWTGSNGTDPQITVTIPTGSTGDKAYTANWTDEYTVVFHSNNGQDQTHRQVIKFDQEVQLDDNVFTNEDKDFKEWTTNSNGTGVKYTNKRVKYSSSARTETTTTSINIVNLPYDDNLEVHLYSQWQEPNLTKTTFDKGQNVNKKMKQLAGNDNAAYSTDDINIRYIKKATSIEFDLVRDTIINNPDNNVTSNYYENYYDEPIYMWFDNGTIYYYSEADILYLNETSNYLFNGLTELISIDFTGIDTSIVKNMESMFNKCKKLEELDLSSFNTSNVITMQYMFAECESLTSLDLSSFNTSKVNNMRNMFSDCRELETLDITNFNTYNVTNMQNMFRYMYKLKSLDLSSFNTSKVTSMIEMFHGVSTITTLDLSSFDTSQVTNMKQMFYECTNLKTLNVSSFNTSNVTNMSQMFSGCSSLIGLDLSSFGTSNVTTMSSMFNGCSSLQSLDLSSFNTSQVTDMNRMFDYMSSIETLDVSSFDTHSVTNMTKMFSNMNLLKTIYASDDFITTSVGTGSDMFINDNLLVGGNNTSCDGSHNITYDYARIDTNATPGYFTKK